MLGPKMCSTVGYNGPRHGAFRMELEEGTGVVGGSHKWQKEKGWRKMDRDKRRKQVGFIRETQRRNKRKY